MGRCRINDEERNQQAEGTFNRGDKAKRCAEKEIHIRSRVTEICK